MPIFVKIKVNHGLTLVEFRKLTLNENARATDLVLHKYYENVWESANIVTGSTEPRKIAKPNVFLHIGYHLNGLYLSSRTLSLKGLELRIEQMRHFIELYETDWVGYTNSARATYKAAKGNSPEELPLEKYVILFKDYCILQ